MIDLETLRHLLDLLDFLALPFLVGVVALVPTSEVVILMMEGRIRSPAWFEPSRTAHWGIACLAAFACAAAFVVCLLGSVVVEW